jgi:hypothetical protein
MSYRIAFPNIPPSEMPDVPASWVDASWHHDACPSYYALSGAWGALRVFVDRASPDDREVPGYARFGLAYIAPDDDTSTVFETDAFGDVLEYVAGFGDGAAARFIAPARTQAAYVDGFGKGRDARLNTTPDGIAAMHALSGPGFRVGDRIVAGTGADRSTGRLAAPHSATLAIVAWDDGTTTLCPIAGIDHEDADKRAADIDALAIVAWDDGTTTLCPIVDMEHEDADKRAADIDALAGRSRSGADPDWLIACLEDVVAAWDGAGRGLDMFAMNEAIEQARAALEAARGE